MRRSGIPRELSRPVPPRSLRARRRSPDTDNAARARRDGAQSHSRAEGALRSVGAESRTRIHGALVPAARRRSPEVGVATPDAHETILERPEGARKSAVRLRETRDEGVPSSGGCPAAPPSVLVAHCAFGGIRVPNARTQHPATGCAQPRAAPATVRVLSVNTCRLMPTATKSAPATL